MLGKLSGAAVLDAAAQPVVVHRVHRFAGGWADVALAWSGVFVVDALFDLGQHLEQQSPALLQVALGGLAWVAVRVGWRQQRHLASDLREQLLLLVLQLIDLSVRFVVGLAELSSSGGWQR